MNDMRVSPETTKQALKAFQAGQVEKSTGSFEVLKIPQGELDHMCLLLFKSGRDADPDRLKGKLFFPVEVENRKGYILSSEEAMKYDS